MIKISPELIYNAELPSATYDAILRDLGYKTYINNEFFVRAELLLAGFDQPNTKEYIKKEGIEQEVSALREVAERVLAKGDSLICFKFNLYAEDEEE